MLRLCGGKNKLEKLCVFSQVSCGILRFVTFNMPNKCGVVNCKGNYNESNKCRVFKLPKDEKEREKWLNVLPPRENFVVEPSKFFICERHWPADTRMVTVPGM